MRAAAELSPLASVTFTQTVMQELVRDSHTERAVWMELVLVCDFCILASVHTSGKKLS